MDHERVNIHQSGISCGVMELSRIGDDTMDVLYAIASRLYHPARGEPCAFFIWSDLAIEENNVSESLNSTVLAEVVNEDYGTITRSPAAENPRTGNHICVTVWEINHAKLKAWYSKERVKRVKKAGT